MTPRSPLSSRVWEKWHHPKDEGSFIFCDIVTLAVNCIRMHGYASGVRRTQTHQILRRTNRIRGERRETWATQTNRPAGTTSGGARELLINTLYLDCSHTKSSWVTYTAYPQQKTTDHTWVEAQAICEMSMCLGKSKRMLSKKGKKEKEKEREREREKE